MSMTEATVQLGNNLLELVDSEANRLGISRSALIREALHVYLARVADARISKANVDEWGDLGEFSHRAARDVAARLDVEETSCGLRAVVARCRLCFCSCLRRPPRGAT